MHAHFSALTRPSFHINNNVGDIRFSDSVVHDLRLGLERGVERGLEIFFAPIKNNQGWVQGFGGGSTICIMRRFFPCPNSLETQSSTLKILFKVHCLAYDDDKPLHKQLSCSFFKQRLWQKQFSTVLQYRQTYIALLRSDVPEPWCQFWGLLITNGLGVLCHRAHLKACPPFDLWFY